MKRFWAWLMACMLIFPCALADVSAPPDGETATSKFALIPMSMAMPSDLRTSYLDCIRGNIYPEEADTEFAGAMLADALFFMAPSPVLAEAFPAPEKDPSTFSRAIMLTGIIYATVEEPAACLYYYEQEALAIVVTYNPDTETGSRTCYANCAPEDLDSLTAAYRDAYNLDAEKVSEAFVKCTVEAYRLLEMFLGLNETGE